MPSLLSYAAASDPLAGLADRFDPPPVDVFGIMGYEPNCKPRFDAAEQGVDVPLCGQCPQEQFHDAGEWDVLYGGAMGGGKTKALLMEGLRACVRYPGIKVLAIRESYPQLAESFLDELAKVDYAKVLGASYNKSDHNLTFRNGSLLRFRYCDGLTDARLRLGTEIQLLLVDEATQQDPDAIDFLRLRLRSSNRAIPALGIRLGTNPGGTGHLWAKERYVDATEHGLRTYVDVIDGKSTGQVVRFIKSRYTDNFHVVDYESVLDAVKDPQLRAAYRDGSWDVFAGQVFGEWRHDRHVVAPFPVPDGWIRFAAVDYGYAAPWCVLWGARDPDGRLWLYRELYDTGVGEKDQARRILDAEGRRVIGADGKTVLARHPAEKVRLRVGDPSMWNKLGDAHPISDTYMAEGCGIVKATNDRLAGAQRVHTYLAEAPACAHHRALGWDTCPLVHVSEACTNLIRTLPALPRDERHPEDVDTDAEDHAYDACRYLMMALPLPHATRQPKAAEDMSAEARMARHIDKRINKRKRTRGRQIG